MGTVGGNRDFGFVGQEAIDGSGAGRDVDMKLCFLKFSLAGGHLDRAGKAKGGETAEVQSQYGEDTQGRATGMERMHE